MFGARFRIFTTCCNLATGRITDSIVNRVCRARFFVTPKYSTRPRGVNLAHPEALRSRSVLGERAPFLLPVRVTSVGRRLYATDKEQKLSSSQEGSKSQSILTRLLEEEQQQPKALTVGERGVYCYGYYSVKLSLF